MAFGVDPIDFDQPEPTDAEIQRDLRIYVMAWAILAVALNGMLLFHHLGLL